MKDKNKVVRPVAFGLATSNLRYISVKQIYTRFTLLYNDGMPCNEK